MNTTSLPVPTGQPLIYGNDPTANPVFGLRNVRRGPDRQAVSKTNLSAMVRTHGVIR